jgi:hypothetical protein
MASVGTSTRSLSKVAMTTLSIEISSKSGPISET